MDKKWPTMSELEKPNLPCFNVEERIQRLREIGMLEWVHHLRPIHQHRERSKDVPFTF